MAATTDSFLDLLRPEHIHDNVEAWRWTVRRRLVPVRDRLHAEPLHQRDAWLSARAACVVRERDALLARLNRALPRGARRPTTSTTWPRG